MKSIELVILIIAVIVMAMALTASAIVSDDTSFLNINFPTDKAQESGLGYGTTDTGMTHALRMAIDRVKFDNSLFIPTETVKRSIT